MTRASHSLMCHGDRLALLAGACLLTVIAGCSAESESGPDAAAAYDSSPETGWVSQDECEPGCHWDCFQTGHQCKDGKVYRIGAGAVPCCHYGETPPWGDGPGCAVGVAHSCESGCRQAASDERYWACLEPSGGLSMSSAGADELYRLMCREGEPHQPGDACTSDHDCRPAAVAVAGSLVCDLQSKTCVQQPRPAASPVYGADCGLVLVDPAWQGDRTMPGNTCELCHVSRTLDSTCVRQACTTKCVFDEDCPEGSVCTCGASNNYGVLQQFCVKGSARSWPERAAWLACSGGDAGAEDAATDSGD